MTDPRVFYDLGARSRSIMEALTSAVAAYPERPAVSLAAQRLTYAQLGEEIDRFSAFLAEFTSSGPVLYSPSNSPSAVAFVFGAVKADRVPVLPDPTWTEAELLEVAERCAIRYVVADTDADWPWLIPVAECDAFRIHEVMLAGRQDEVTPRLRTAVCRFTSGTTGFSRCLEFSDESVLEAARSWWLATKLGPDDVVLCLATLNNGLAFNTSLLCTFLAGAELVFHSGPPIPSRVARTSERARPTVLVAFPFVYEGLMASLRHRIDSSRLRLAISSAAPLRQEVLDRFRERHGVAISNYYGLVEAGPCTFNDGSVPGSVGFALEGVSFKVIPVDRSEARASRGVGEADLRGVGRIHVRTRALASGYLDRRGPCFADSLDEEGFYATQDLGTLTEGDHLMLCGRTGGQINVEGRKIDPREVEDAIRQLAGVTDVFVRGEETKRRSLVAAYVESRTVTQTDVIEACRRHLAPYKRPQRVRVWPALPRSAAGKILSTQLSS